MLVTLNGLTRSCATRARNEFWSNNMMFQQPSREQGIETYEIKESLYEQMWELFLEQYFEKTSEYEKLVGK